ncbi:MAG: sporulation integral membrane protein YlbJ [Clostridia bacterium]|nr:sporulation integral membrane protein YlbJ [Clostridia bacterium]
MPISKLRKNFLPILFLLFTICLLIFSKSNLQAVKSGLSLWANSVIPSLFPFFVATELLMHTNIIYFFQKYLNKFIEPIFNVRGAGCFAFLMGIISGYPIGAKIACEFRKSNTCSKEECERLLSFTNNSGPLFIIGTVGISMFGSSQIGLILFISHLLASITVGFIFRFWHKNSSNNSYKIFKTTNTKFVKFSNLGEVLSESIKQATSTIMLIGGFIVIFSSIISILNNSNIFNFLSIILEPIFNLLNIDISFINGLLTGLLEITNGIKQISTIQIKKISINLILTSLLLGFGGISILLQVFSIVSKTDLSIKPYIYGKILQGLVSALYTFIILQCIPILNLDL